MSNVDSEAEGMFDSVRKRLRLLQLQKRKDMVDLCSVSAWEKMNITRGAQATAKHMDSHFVCMFAILI